MPSYLTTSDVATRLGVSLDTVRRWLRSGELKGTPFGRAGYRIEDADFQAFLQQRRRQLRKVSISSPEQYSLSNAALEELINAIGQELRTPLTTTRGALQQARRLLQSALESPMSDNAIDLLTKLQGLLARTERQISAEMRLVGNLLDASRIESNKFELSLACDFRIASETTFYALPEQKLGQIPGSGGSARLQKMIGEDIQGICIASAIRSGRVRCGSYTNIRPLTVT